MTVPDLQRLEAEYTRGYMVGFTDGLKAAAEIAERVSVTAASQIREVLTGRRGVTPVQADNPPDVE